MIEGFFITYYGIMGCLMNCATNMQNGEQPDTHTYIKKGRNGIYLSVLINPRVKRSEVRGVHGERLKIAVASPPVDGAANRALIEFIAELLDISKSSVSLEHGEGSREKTISIVGLTREEVCSKINSVISKSAK